MAITHPIPGVKQPTPGTSHPVPGMKCPKCLEKGKTVWVMPGKNCPQCNHPCG